MSATQVPLRPIAKGSVAKFWLAILALIAVGVALAALSTAPVRGETTESGLNIRVIEEGDGDPLTANDAALLEYEGSLASTGEVFDSTIDNPVPMIPEGHIPGFDEGLLKMRAGGEYRITIPADIAYGADGRPPVIPPNSDLVFRIKILEIGRDLAPMIRMQQQQMAPPMPPMPQDEAGQ
ncbi:FKBP-type peptidyl-prolyl cis-trans isomerase [Sphingomicrobium sediminis]|uniref:Peptidyl-prolyl cis-trans isomerase n=1 Tax=Sphingomicrobium sediminis TaxID=2950949 RepID=A0A9X2EK41_9SPHN|nr:FKBP-type peptidyl-prolyl cis-trans isomerase [Sphingomicrobium sediminis]MCM8558301.1 FKBP-type peptidyl-prolyl cis-trans isomerase [Sphingomicrobium sediminis]